MSENLKSHFFSYKNIARTGDRPGVRSGRDTWSFKATLEPGAWELGSPRTARAARAARAAGRAGGAPKACRRSPRLPESLRPWPPRGRQNCRRESLLASERRQETHGSCCCDKQLCATPIGSVPVRSYASTARGTSTPVHKPGAILHSTRLTDNAKMEHRDGGKAAQQRHRLNGA